MADLNIMSLYTDAYLADTTHLSTEQHGAYLLLLVAMWRAGGKLSDDPSFLQRVTKVSPKRWDRMWEEIGHFFVADGKGSISQKRLRAEYVKALHRKEVYSSNGRQGGRPNSLKSQKVDKATGYDPVKQNESKDKANQKLNESHSSFESGYPDQKLSLLLTPNSLAAANSESGKGQKSTTREFLLQLEAKCREAADVVNETSPSLLIMQPVTALLEAGYDLDTDVLPIMRKFAKAGRRGKSWAYYVEAITESRDKARAAVNGSGNDDVKETPEQFEKRMRVRWDHWKRGNQWPFAWGQAPDVYGCEIPKELIERWSAETP
jgi:uncharacterized protein YdaU (DUF1376 family)